MDINNEGFIKILEWLRDEGYAPISVNDGKHKGWHQGASSIIYPDKAILEKAVAALQPSTLPVKSDNECKSIWHNHHVRMSHFCTLCGGATLIEKNEPSTLPLIETENRDPFSLERIIAYMERTKEEDWLLDKVRSKDGTKHCFFSHLFNMGGGYFWEMFEEMYATEYMLYPVNDCKNEKYQQPTSKERVIAYLKDLRDGKQQTTHQMMEEEYATFKNKKQ